jgi:hypothetical protein
MPGVFPDYPAPVIRGNGEDREMLMMRWGDAAASKNRRATRDEHPQHLVSALAGLAEA